MFFLHFSKCLISIKDTWRGIEVVITGLTRNQFASNRTWVRIPSSPPKHENTVLLCGVFYFIPEKYKKAPARNACRGHTVRVIAPEKQKRPNACNAYQGLPSVKFIPKNSNASTRKTRVKALSWRRTRDLNPRAGFSRPTPLAGEPLHHLGSSPNAEQEILITHIIISP